MRRAGLAIKVENKMRAAIGRLFCSVEGMRTAAATVPVRTTAEATQQIRERMG